MPAPGCDTIVGYSQEAPKGQPGGPLGSTSFPGGGHPGLLLSFRDPTGRGRVAYIGPRSFASYVAHRSQERRREKRALANHIDVIYPADVRPCAKVGCEGRAVATVGVRYAERLVLVGPLVDESDPNLLDLCEDHAARLTPPRGWERVDVPAMAPDPPVAEPLTA